MVLITVIVISSSLLMEVQWDKLMKPCPPVVDTGNDLALRSVVILCNTGTVHHVDRARLAMKTWASLLPDPRQVVFLTDANDTSSLFHPYQGVSFALSPKLSGYQNAQQRFGAGLLWAARRTWPAHIRWLLLVDDDAYVVVPSLASLIRRLDALGLPPNHVFGEVQCGPSNICGGAGVLFTLNALRKAQHHLASCSWLPYYDVQISGCLRNAGLHLMHMLQFCGGPSKSVCSGRHKVPRVPDMVTFHYAVDEMTELHQRVLSGKNALPCVDPHLLMS